MLNREVLQETGNLSVKEKAILEDLKGILEKYNFGSEKGFIGQPFLTNTDKETWSVVGQWIDPLEVSRLQHIFASFEDRFNHLWPTIKKRLTVWKKVLSQESKSQNFNLIDKELSVFFDTPSQERTRIKVYLLVSSQNFYAGQANIGKNTLTLECSGVTPRKHKNNICSLLWHETIHTAYERNYLNPLIFSYLKEKDPAVLQEHPVVQVVKDPSIPFREGVISSLFSGGVLARRYFSVRPTIGPDELEDKLQRFTYEKAQSLAFWCAFCAEKLKPLTESYLDQKRKIDQDYLESVFEVYKSYTHLFT